MVCIYCGGDTTVTNSRLNKRQNQVWRRRKCATCHSLFTTHELVDLATTHSILQPNGKLVPFSHAKLLLSIYKSCAHRPNAIEDSSALSATTIARLLNNKTGATILLSDIRETVNTMLNHFDAAAAAHYAAYHPADATIKTR